MLAIELQGLSKTYGLEKESALADVSLQIKQGDFFGLLGLNGAGKTTLISILVGLVRPTEGRALVLGHDVAKEPYLAKKLTGVVPQEMNINLFNTVKEVMFNHGGYYGMTRKQVASEYEEILYDLHLLNRENSTIRALSGGMKRRVLLARALLVQPKVLILDEPTAGVDVELRQDVWRLLKRANQKGTTILLTTHYMEEAEYLCENIAILHQGKIIDQGHKSELSISGQSRHLVLHLQSDISDVCQQDLIEVERKDSKTLSLQIHPGADLSKYLQTLEAQGAQVGHVSSPTSRLEQYFRSQTG